MLLRILRKGTLRWVGGAEMKSGQVGWPLSLWHPTSGRDIMAVEVPREEGRVQDPNWTSKPMGYAQKRNPYNIWL